MALDIRQAMARTDDARSLLREIYTSRADILPGPKNKTLTIRLHHLANPLSGKAARHLAALLNQTEQGYPGTDLRRIYKLVSEPYP